MNVHRVGVIHDVLPAAHDLLPLRKETRQQPHLVHRDERTRHPLPGAQDPQKDLLCGWVAAKRIADQVQAFAHQPLRLPRERHVVLLRDGERLQQEYRILLQLPGMGDLEPAPTAP